MTPHAKRFLSKLLALQKKPKWKPTTLGLILGKHRDTLKNWKKGTSWPSLDDIAEACCKLSKELSRRDKVNERAIDQANAIESFLVEFLNDTGFKSKKL